MLDMSWESSNGHERQTQVPASSVRDRTWEFHIVFTGLDIQVTEATSGSSSVCSVTN